MSAMIAEMKKSLMHLLNSVISYDTMQDRMTDSNDNKENLVWYTTKTAEENAKEVGGYREVDLYNHLRENFEKVSVNDLLQCIAELYAEHQLYQYKVLKTEQGIAYEYVYVYSLTPKGICKLLDL